MLARTCGPSSENSCRETRESAVSFERGLLAAGHDHSARPRGADVASDTGASSAKRPCSAQAGAIPAREHGAEVVMSISSAPSRARAMGTILSKVDFLDVGRKPSIVITNIGRAVLRWRRSHANVHQRRADPGAPPSLRSARFQRITAEAQMSGHAPAPMTPAPMNSDDRVGRAYR